MIKKWYVDSIDLANNNREAHLFDYHFKQLDSFD